MEKLAKGSWQREICRNLESGKEIRSPLGNLKGKAKSYSLHYSSSFSNLLSRLVKAGYKIQRTPGPRGGEYSATYRLV
mgnify:CR=1 FL=1